jgi:hypothetical protein
LWNVADLGDEVNCPKLEVSGVINWS